MRNGLKQLFCITQKGNTINIDGTKEICKYLFGDEDIVIEKFVGSSLNRPRKLVRLLNASEEPYVVVLESTEKSGTSVLFLDSTHGGIKKIIDCLKSASKVSSWETLRKIV